MNAKQFNIEKFNILLVEDNLQDIEMIHILLQSAGKIQFELTSVHRLSEALGLYRAGNQFDIILLDLGLPDSEGLDTLAKVINTFGTKPSILVLTGNENPALALNAIEFGAQDFLNKLELDQFNLTRAILHANQRRKIMASLQETVYNLKVSESKLIEAQKVAQIITYHANLTTNTLQYISDSETVTFNNQPVPQAISTIDDFFAFLGHKGQRFWLKNRSQLLKKPTTYSYEYANINENKELEYFRDQGKAYFDSGTENVMITGAIQNITEKKIAEMRILEAEERYRVIFQELKDGVFLLDDKSRLREFNDAICKITGQSREELQNVQLSSLFAFSSGEEKNNFDVASLLNSEKEIPLWNASVGKRDCIVFLSRLQLSPDGSRAPLLYGIIRDITESKLNQELLKAKEVAENSARLKAEFLARMSHEIRTPLNIIINIAYLLQGSSLTSQQQEYLRDLQISSSNLLSLINNILDFSKLDAGKAVVENKPFNLRTLINNLIQTHRYQSTQKNIRLYTTIESSLPEVVIGDALKLYQVLHNLISNAIKYTDKGKVIISLQTLEEDAEEVCIEFLVEDTGIGISKDKQQQVFDSFVQGGSDVAYHYGGTGLGLSIAKRLIEVMGGSLTLDSTEGQGSSFIFDLKFTKKHLSDSLVPLVQREYEQQHQQFAPVGMEEGFSVAVLSDVTEKNMPDLTPINILLVEDHVVNQKIALALLRKHFVNAQIDIAENGKMATQKLQKNSNYDVVLMDISMPVMDGYNATRIIREELKLSREKLPIIAMTANAFRWNEKKCYEVGMNNFITKPIVPELLYNTISNLINKANNVETMLDLSEIAIKKEVEEVEDSTAISINHNGIAVPEEDEIIQLDFTYLNSISGNDAQLKRSFIDNIAETMPTDIDQIRQAFADQQPDKLRAAAHKIKSTAHYIGVEKMATLAKYIENSLWEDQANIGQLKNSVETLLYLAEKSHQLLKK